ncbi:MAG: maltotransferase domain-containing protein [Aquihabitans sp.]
MTRPRARPKSTTDHQVATFTTPAAEPPRVRVERPWPLLDGGRYRVRSSVGETVTASAEVIRDGHEVLRAELLAWGPEGGEPTVTPMVNVDASSLGVRWAADLPLDRVGIWTWTVRAWADALASWRIELTRKVDGGLDDLSGELAEGALLLATAAERAHADSTTDGEAIAQAAGLVGDASKPQTGRVAVALDPVLAERCDRHPDRSRAGQLEEPVAVQVDPELARFGAWYELFPRSWGGFTGIRRRLPALAELGFDVVYLPPVSPIGLTKRKGPNNALIAGPDDPGSPWAIGDASGGHDAIHPELGTVSEFEALVTDARAFGLEVALDFAVQCSADHPWLTEHPEWFAHRPDGTLKYAENPPKKYQDIYNVDFDSDDWAGLWAALRDVLLTWIDRGVRVFRVDNPHTKSLAFWEWLIDGVRETRPDVIFLAEAFTHRAMMRQLAKVGFHQGYTYFTWKQEHGELAEYVTELAGDERLYFRPNFFVNTPDILTEQLQTGGPSTFASRLILAATLSPSYGIYSGYENFEHEAVAPGSEEYLDSEKYQVRDRGLDGPLLPLVADLNRIRRSEPALRHLAGTRILDTESTGLFAFAKQADGDTVLCVVLLDGHTAQEGVCIVPDDLGLPPSFTVHDRLSGETYSWHLGRNYVKLEPGLRPAHILHVERSGESSS